MGDNQFPRSTTLGRLVGGYIQKLLQVPSFKKIFVGLSGIAFPIFIGLGTAELSLNPVFRLVGVIDWFALAALDAVLVFWTWEAVTELNPRNRVMALVVFGLLVIVLLHHELRVARETADEAFQNDANQIGRSLQQQTLESRLLAGLKVPSPAGLKPAPVQKSPATPAELSKPPRPQRRAPFSFPFLAPGVWLNFNTWDFLVNHRGPEPAYNTEILFVDDVKRAEVLRGKTSLTRADIDSYQQIIKLPEIDSKGCGTVFAKQFLWTPPVADHERYTIDATWRDGSVHEELQIERLDEKWFWAAQVKNAETGEMLVNCRDKGFPGGGPPLEECFPKYLRTD